MALRMMRLTVLSMFLGKSLGACPCLDESTVLSSLSSYMSSGELRFQDNVYPSNYGVNCSAHDETLEPFCKVNPVLWCFDAWCYIDTNKCDLAMPPSASSYFPTSQLHFSYSACGSRERWYLNNLEASAEVVSNYVQAVKVEIEANYASMKTSSSCFAPGCDCPGCAQVDHGYAWAGKEVDFSTCMVNESPSQDITDTSTCLAQAAIAPFMRTANAEYTDQRDIGFLYMGMQEDGAYIQWPDMSCFDSYDPRFRDWYSGTYA